jgi:hypothetical protein
MGTANGGQIRGQSNGNGSLSVGKEKPQNDPPAQSGTVALNRQNGRLIVGNFSIKFKIKFYSVKTFETQ